ncbi:MAG TPA: mechanosensitive ion channel [Atopostipes sp.]|jgi:hypothetical protein|nr:mechanosensitive ion channel [Atopostipes sp.]
MDQLQNTWNSFAGVLPSIIGGIVLILVAWIVATLVKNAITKGLRAADMDNRLVGWGAARSEEQGAGMIDMLGQVFYYLVWVLFLPGIFETFGLTSVAQPIQNMLHTALAFLPNLLAAVALVVVAFVVGKFVRNLVYNLALTLNVDRWISKLTGQTDNSASGRTAQSEATNAASTYEDKKDSIAKVLANIVYVLILIPILTVALEVLGIRSISEPIINVLNSIMAAIPNILVAVILLAVGIAIAKFVGDIVTNLLQGTGINNLTNNVNVSGAENFDLAKIIGQVVAGLIGLFFFVEALNALNLQVLNAIGAAIIGYLPNVIFALIILGLGIIGGQWLGNLFTRSSGSRWAGRLVHYLLIAFSLFMVLDQLNFASTIVNTAFMFIIGGTAVAFALAFGLGGRDFARKQLEKLDDKVDEEKNKNESPGSDQKKPSDYDM